MITNYRIAAYTRISVDTELDKDNTSIENQKAIIEDYCKINFPTSTVDYFEDRDHSGYTFEQRPDYWIRLRPIIYEDSIEIKLQADVDELLRTGTIEHMKNSEEGEVPVNFNSDTENIEISTEDCRS